MPTFNIGDRVRDNGTYPRSNGGLIGTITNSLVSGWTVDFGNGNSWYYHENEMIKVDEEEMEPVYIPEVGDVVKLKSGSVFSNGQETNVIELVDKSSWGDTRCWFKGLGTWAEPRNLIKVGKEGVKEMQSKFKVGDFVWMSDGYHTSVPVFKVTEVRPSCWGNAEYKLDGYTFLAGEYALHKYDPEECNPFFVGDFVTQKNYIMPSRVTGVDGPFVRVEHDGWTHHSIHNKYEPCEAVLKWGGFKYVTEDAYSGLMDFLPQSAAKFCYDPQIRVDGDKLKVSLYQNRADWERGRRTVLKVGRAVRMVYPNFTDKEVQTWVDKINRKFSPRKYTLKTGTRAKDFVHAYTHKQSPYENPRTTSSRKCLADSCMRYNFVGDEGFDWHPVEAYASGDFMIVWTEDDDGNIGSRAVVSTHGDEWVAGPVYGVCEKSLDMIEEYITSHDGHLFKGDLGWTGARVCKLDSGDDRYVGPYFDSGEYLRDDGKFFVVDPNGSIGTSDHEGYFEYDNRPMCYACECRVREDYVMHSEDGYSYCDECYHERYTYCEEDDCEINADDAVYVQCKTRWGYGAMTVHSDYAVQCSYSHEWWHINDIVEDYHGDPVSPQYAYDNLSVCESSGKWCKADETVSVSVDNEQQVWHKDELSDDYVESDGIYYLKEELEKEAT
jgi:hypothetical protein